LLSDYTKKRKKALRYSEQDSGINNTESVHFASRPNTGSPCSPNRYFESSFDVSFDKIEIDRDINVQKVTNKRVRTEYRGYQVVHIHANGLCVITAGDLIQYALKNNQNCSDKRPCVKVEGVSFLKGKGIEDSIGHSIQQNKERNEREIVLATDILALVNLSDGDIVELKCCVSGIMLEINQHLFKKKMLNTVPTRFVALKKSLIESDPLLCGYLAIIKPSSSFNVSC